MIVGLSALFALSLINVNFNDIKNENQHSSKLAFFEKVALADSECDCDSKDCPGGSNECFRVTVGNEVHIFYEN